MSRQRQAFGNATRAPVINAPGSGVGATTIQFFGETYDPNATGDQGVAATFRGNKDNVLNQQDLGTSFAAVASLMYGTRLGSDGQATTRYDRVRTGLTNADAQATEALGALLALARLTGFNGTTWDRLRSGGDSADAVATATLGELLTLARNTVFNNSTWDRLRSGSAANLATFLSLGAALAVKPGNWSITHTPTTATQATISRAAGGAGVRHVCTSISYALIIPPTVNQPLIQVNLRDGATGAGTILWSETVGVGAALANGGDVRSTISDLEIVGTANTAMTLEFSAAGAATTSESVALTGHDCS